MIDSPFEFEELLESEEGSEIGDYLYEYYTSARILQDKLRDRQARLTRQSNRLLPIFRYKNFKDIYENIPRSSI